jgi:uncharacterized protein (DUF427 family)
MTGRHKPGEGRAVPAAVWRDTVLADSAHTIVVAGTHYFPPDTVRWEHLIDSPTRSRCWWKGQACYLPVAVDDEVLADAAGYYPRPWPPARRLRYHVAFSERVTLSRSST